MKRLVILIGLVLLLGGGVAGWWFFLREDPAADTADAPVDPGDGVATVKYVELNPFMIPILREGRVTQHMSVILTVELDRPMPDDDVELLMPRLRDAIFRELHGVYAFRHVQDAGEDLPIVKRRLIGASEQVFGDGAVKAVLVKATTKRAPDSG